MISLIVLQVISSGLNLLGINQHLTLAIWGGTLVAAMAVRFYFAPLIGEKIRYAYRARGGDDRRSREVPERD
jgi:ribose/xylose/arabinose/galactoside ABC-type transport system permease subunit